MLHQIASNDQSPMSAMQRSFLGTAARLGLLLDFTVNSINVQLCNCGKMFYTAIASNKFNHLIWH